MSLSVRTVAVAIFFGVVFLEFLSLARSLQCYKCTGSSKEPVDEPSCSNQTENCTGAQNTCMTRLYKSSGKITNFQLQCQAEVDCKRGKIGCDETEAQTICTYCCNENLCNDATHMDEETDAPTTKSGSRQLQPLANVLFLVSLAAVYFVKGV